MPGVHLAVDEPEVPALQLPDQPDEGDLGGIAGAGKHRFAKEHPANGNAVQSPDQFAIQPAFYRVGIPGVVQPDIGSLQISYRGPRIDRAGLLRYIVSYRQHSDFHEACVERMFVDVRQRCEPTQLSLHARYQRRGGIDINPFRSTVDEVPRNPRLWRQ